jgi:hypothetical protein
VTVIYDESLTDEEKLNVTIFVRYGDRLLLSAVVIIQFDSSRYELVSNAEGAYTWTLDTTEMEGLYAFTVIVNTSYGDYGKDYHFTITRVRIVFPVTISEIAGYMMRSPLSMSITGIFVFCLLIAVATRRRKKKPEDEVREREEQRLEAILGKRERKEKKRRSLIGWIRGRKPLTLKRKQRKLKDDNANRRKLSKREAKNNRSLSNLVTKRKPTILDTKRGKYKLTRKKYKLNNNNNRYGFNSKDKKIQRK